MSELAKVQWRAGNREAAEVRDGIVVQGNWQEDKVMLDGKPSGWLPARLKGTTRFEKLQFDFTYSGADGEATLRTDGEDKAMSLPREIKGGDNHGVKVEIQPGDPDDAGMRQWEWKGYIYVDSQRGVNPATVKLRAYDPQNTFIGERELVLGEYWILAGGGGVTERLPVTVLPAGKFQVGVGTAKIEGHPLFKPEAGRSPALSHFLCDRLASGFEARKKGARPVCVLNIGSARSMIAAWHGDAAVWVPTLAKGGQLPGYRGIIWWHGEWEAEYSPVLVEDKPDPGGRFREGYRSAVVALRESLLEALCPASAGDAATEHRKRIIWVMLQSAAVDRKPEFFEQVQSAVPHPFVKDGPISSWAELRAAQFEVVEELRSKQSGIGRPVSLLVPLMDHGGTAAGWIWKAEDVRYAALASRLAEEIANTMTAPGTAPEQIASSFADGWPAVEWKADGPLLRFAGGARVVEAADGKAAVLRVRIPAADPEWQAFKIPAADPEGKHAEIKLPDGTEEIRYAWGDDPGRLCRLEFLEPEPPPPAAGPVAPAPGTPPVAVPPRKVLRETILPAFRFVKPATATP